MLFSERTNVKMFFVGIFFSLFLLNEVVRLIFPGKSGYLNVLFLVVASLFLIYSFLHRRMQVVILFIVIVLSAIVLMNGKLVLQYSTANLILTIVSLIMPLMLMSVKINRELMLDALDSFLIFFNWLIITLVGLGMIDYVTNGSIQLWLASTVYAETEIGELIFLEHSFGIYRYYSFIGHPLVNANYLLVFFILNHIYGRNRHFKLNRMLLIALTLVGLLLCASKSALLLGLILVFFLNPFKKYRWLQLLLLVLVLIGLYMTPLFQENLFQRYKDGYVTGNLTTGRNAMIELLLQSREDMPPFFWGGGWGYSRQVAMNLNGDNMNFEYSSIMLAFDYGVVATVLIYLCIFIYPLIVFVRNRDYKTLFEFAILTIMFNGNNGLASLDGDAMARLCLLVLILLSVSMNNRKKPNKET